MQELKIPFSPKKEIRRILHPAVRREKQQADTISPCSLACRCGLCLLHRQNLCPLPPTLFVQEQRMPKQWNSQSHVSTKLCAGKRSQTSSIEMDPVERSDSTLLPAVLRDWVCFCSTRCVSANQRQLYQNVGTGNNKRNKDTDFLPTLLLQLVVLPLSLHLQAAVCHLCCRARAGIFAASSGWPHDT